MIPLRDINPTRRFPIATTVLIAINVLVFLFFELPLSERALNTLFFDWAVIPWEVTNRFTGETAIDIVRAMFMHGGWMHLIGNMLYLWIFGDNLEDRLGIPLYVAFYLLCGFAATFGQVAVDPGSQIPMLGASGAIAGVLGGYLLLFPHARVQGVIFLFYYFNIVEIRAIWVLGLWFALQLFNGLMSAGALAGGGVAWFAHIGGFVAGMALIWLYKQLVPQSEESYPKAPHPRAPGAIFSPRQDLDSLLPGQPALSQQDSRLGAPGSGPVRISPREEQERLRQAYQLIRAKRYDEAMALLETIPWNPLAREWLHKLYDLVEDL